MYGLQTTTEEAPPATAEIPKLGISVAETTDTYGRFVAEPLERGWGMTLGTALRRTLLNSLPGTAVTWVKIDGVLHEYSTITGVKEEVGEILMNIKQVRLRSLANRPGRLRLEVEGEGEVRAGDIMTSSDFEIVNPELHIATLDSAKARLSIEFNVEQGTGYVPASHDAGLPIGVLPVDAIYSPIRKVNVRVENTRAGQHTNLERLVLEVWTDGTISPMDAVRVAANQLMERFYLFSNLEKDGGAAEGAAAMGLAAGPYNTPVESLGLSARTLNCLKRAGINRVGEVLAMPKKDLLKIRNFGQKSLSELYERLEALGLVSPEQARSVTGEPAAETAEAEEEAESDEA
ncbi:MAG: DNA-directed RNA polymerase subunit alpha [Chloroflexi bacterium]|nr:DNA-directed RNA polymerase subunit alpha [Chloroflexota bacterium]